MIKYSFIAMGIFVILLMIAEYFARGYFAWGAEIMIVPLWIVITYEFIAAERKKGR